MFNSSKVSSAAAAAASSARHGALDDDDYPVPTYLTRYNFDDAATVGKGKREFQFAHFKVPTAMLPTLTAANALDKLLPWATPAVMAELDAAWNTTNYACLRADPETGVVEVYSEKAWEAVDYSDTACDNGTNSLGNLIRIKIGFSNELLHHKSFNGATLRVSLPFEVNPLAGMSTKAAVSQKLASWLHSKGCVESRTVFSATGPVYKPSAEFLSTFYWPTEVYAVNPKMFLIVNVTELTFAFASREAYHYHSAAKNSDDYIYIEFYLNSNACFRALYDKYYKTPERPSASASASASASSDPCAGGLPALDEPSSLSEAFDRGQLAVQGSRFGYYPPGSGARPVYNVVWSKLWGWPPVGFSVPTPAPDPAPVASSASSMVLDKNLVEETKAKAVYSSPVVARPDADTSALIDAIDRSIRASVRDAGGSGAPPVPPCVVCHYKMRDEAPVQDLHMAYVCKPCRDQGYETTGTYNLYGKIVRPGDLVATSGAIGHNTVHLGCGSSGFWQVRALIERRGHPTSSVAVLTEPHDDPAKSHVFKRSPRHVLVTGAFDLHSQDAFGRRVHNNGGDSSASARMPVPPPAPAMTYVEWLARKNKKASPSPVPPKKSLLSMMQGSTAGRKQPREEEEGADQAAPPLPPAPKKAKKDEESDDDDDDDDEQAAIAYTNAVKELDELLTKAKARAKAESSPPVDVCGECLAREDGTFCDKHNV